MCVWETLANKRSKYMLCCTSVTPPPYSEHKKIKERKLIKTKRKNTKIYMRCQKYMQKRTTHMRFWKHEQKEKHNKYMLCCTYGTPPPYSEHQKE